MLILSINFFNSNTNLLVKKLFYKFYNKLLGNIDKNNYTYIYFLKKSFKIYLLLTIYLAKSTF